MKLLSPDLGLYQRSILKHKIDKILILNNCSLYLPNSVKYESGYAFFKATKNAPYDHAILTTKILVIIDMNMITKPYELLSPKFSYLKK